MTDPVAAIAAVLAKIETEIAESKISLAACTNTLEDSKESTGELIAFVNNPDEFLKMSVDARLDKLSELTDRGDRARLTHYIADLTETLHADLMYCPLAYVITETRGIVSPAGCSLESRIFIKTKVAINTDTPNQARRGSSMRLYANKIT